MKNMGNNLNTFKKITYIGIISSGIIYIFLFFILLSIELRLLIFDMPGIILILYSCSATIGI
ncbi:MAG: hypothetical protein HF967_02435 [Methanosarcinales archaeon]|nr:hypothetical protein [Methanosarcinales archaeon]